MTEMVKRGYDGGESAGVTEWGTEMTEWWVAVG